MNARTARLLNRVAFVVAQAEARVEQLSQEQGGKKRRVPTAAMQLAHLKRAWHTTPRPERGATRVRLVDLFHTIAQGPNV